MKHVDPMDYFRTCVLDESLVLGLAFDSENYWVDLVISYAAEVVSRAFERRLRGQPVVGEPEPCDFRHFRFGLVREPLFTSKVGGSSVGWDTIQEQLNSRPHVITGVTHERVDDRIHSAFFVGRIGRLKMEYQSLQVEARMGSGVPVGEAAWVYHDVHSGEQFDYYDPFHMIEDEEPGL